MPCRSFVWHQLTSFNVVNLQVDAEIEKDKLKIRTHIQYEYLRGVLQGASVNSYDGFRFIVQKQINLNTAVSHL
jgi:hypothetical protein